MLRVGLLHPKSDVEVIEMELSGDFNTVKDSVKGAGFKFDPMSKSWLATCNRTNVTFIKGFLDDDQRLAVERRFRTMIVEIKRSQALTNGQYPCSSKIWAQACCWYPLLEASLSWEEAIQWASAHSDDPDMKHAEMVALYRKVSLEEAMKIVSEDRL